MPETIQEPNPHKVDIFDTTLRDGLQAIGVNVDIEGRVEIATQLDRMGVDIIEAGFPGSGKANSDHEFEAVRAVAVEIGNATVASLCRAVPADIEKGWEAAEPAKDKGGARLHVFISTSDIHMHQQDKTPEMVIEEAAAAVEHAKSFTDDVEFSPMDASRSDFAFMMQVCREAVERGATVINIPDTTGYMDPRQYGDMIGRAAKQIHRTHPDVVISAHCHNDRDMATMNTLEAVAAGARQVEVSVNGQGERPGNAKLASVVSGIHEGTSYFPTEIFTGVDTRELTYASQVVADLSGRPLAVNEPLTGRYAFAHGSGVHQDGVIDDVRTYECLVAEDYGQTAGEVVLGSLSGKAGVRSRLRAIGFNPDYDEVRAITVHAKELATSIGRDLDDTDIEQIMADSTGEEITDSVFVEDIRDIPDSVMSEIVLNLGEDGKDLPSVDLRANAIERAVTAINKTLGFDGHIRDLHANALSAGEDAEAGSYVDVVSGDISVKAYAEGESVDKASIKAYVAAISLVKRTEERVATVV